MNRRGYMANSTPIRVPSGAPGTAPQGPHLMQFDNPAQYIEPRDEMTHGYTLKSVASNGGDERHLPHEADPAVVVQDLRKSFTGQRKAMSLRQHRTSHVAGDVGLWIVGSGRGFARLVGT